MENFYRDDRNKSYETREVIYTCNYTSGHLIPTSVIYSRAIVYGHMEILASIAAGIDEILCFMASYLYHPIP